MPEHDPTPRRRLSASQARTVRHWIIGLITASVLLTMMAPNTTEDQDRAITLVVAASLTTGAVVVRRPIGFRIILTVATIIAMCSAMGWLRV